jgi:hypothetical protein
LIHRLELTFHPYSSFAGSTTRIAKAESFRFLPSTFDPGRMLFLPVSPRFAPAGTATLELATVAIFDNHIVPGQRMADLADLKQDKHCSATQRSGRREMNATSEPKIIPRLA